MKEFSHSLPSVINKSAEDGMLALPVNASIADIIAVRQLKNGSHALISPVI
jgi:hypothetical protein